MLFNVIHTWFYSRSLMQAIFTGMHSAVTLCALYGYNDYKDCQRDVMNPRKNQSFVAEINTYSRSFLLTHVMLSALSIVSAIYFGIMQAVAAVVLFLVNTLYSNRLKSTPLADVFTVAVWGGLFTLIIPSVNYKLAVLAGVMTGIAHLFQIMTDAETDRKTGVLTTAVAFPQKLTVVLVLLSFILAALIGWITEVWMFASLTALPLAISLLARSVGGRWLAWRFFFVIVWIGILLKLYEVN